MRNLNANQTQACEKLGSLKVGALFMECGTGKTQAAVELINSVEELDLLLWICPCQTKQNLYDEIQKCGLKYTPYIFGIESISSSNRVFQHIYDLLNKSKKSFIVCDESLKIKNLFSKRTKRLLLLSDMAEYKLILNGTPLTKDILDIYPQMQFLSRKILGMTFREFKNIFCEYVTIKKNGYIVKSFIRRYHNVDHLIRLIEPYVYNCNLNLSLQKYYREISYSLSENEMSEYMQLKKQLLDDAMFGGFHFLSLTQKMQHGYCCSEEKFDILRDLVDDKTIVYCKFIRSQEVVTKKFPNILCLTYGKGSIGLNLQDYNKVVYFDKTFDYAFREQSEARIYRTGQHDNCLYYDLTANVGLDTILNSCIERKIGLVQYFKQEGNKIRNQL